VLAPVARVFPKAARSVDEDLERSVVALMWNKRALRRNTTRPVEVTIYVEGLSFGVSHMRGDSE